MTGVQTCALPIYSVGLGEIPLLWRVVACHLTSSILLSGFFVTVQAFELVPGGRNRVSSQCSLLFFTLKSFLNLHHILSLVFLVKKSHTDSCVPDFEIQLAFDFDAQLLSCIVKGNVDHRSARC